MICPACSHKFEIREPSSLLTPRELETVRFLMNGMSKNKQIAKAMNTTEQVVKNRFRNVYRKLGLRRRIDLILMNVSELEVKEKVQ